MKVARIALGLVAALAASAAVAATNWLTAVDIRGGGHKVGNPAAKVKLTEFVSYTCPSCARFQLEGGGALEVYVVTGLVQLDVRHVVRDPVDLTAAMLANCGAPARFPANHKALMLAQPTWLPLAAKATAGQTARWSTGPGASRRRAIASDLQFYELMARQGYERVALDRCLGDEALAKRLADQSAADDAKWKVAGTPSFALGGTMLAGVHGWAPLRPHLDSRL